MAEKKTFPQKTWDYSLIGAQALEAEEKGLADANWYASSIPREKMKDLLVRRDGPAIRDTLIWFGLLFTSSFLVLILWGSWWFVLPYMVYTIIYASTSDSRWHESSHGTAFKTDWMNRVLYEIASFMVVRQSTVWRWSHTRHHSDTLVRGRDPEIAAPRPPDIAGILMNFFALRSAPAEFRKIFIHASGRIHKEVATYLPKSEYPRVIRTARIYLVIYASAIASSIILKTPLPVMFIGLPTLLGTWLMPVYGLTQHAGLAENVLDHRLNCRTVYMNRVNRFLYWNMNYHIEHHMFPLVPYHALPRLHELMKHDCPPPYKSIGEAFREIVPALRRQVRDPGYFVERILPKGAGTGREPARGIKLSSEDVDEKGLLRVCSLEDMDGGEITRIDLDDHTYALYNLGREGYFLSDGICTHGNSHLSEGLIVGKQVECSKHNGRFDITDGSARRLPVCEALRTYELVYEGAQVFVDVKVLEKENSTLEFQVVSNRNLSTYIKELVLEPLQQSQKLSYTPGDYLKLEIPAHRTGFESMDIEDPFSANWKKENVFRNHAYLPIHTKRNYSLAGNPEKDSLLKFNIRIALPPQGGNCYAGIGSAWIFNLKPGDLVRASGPFGEFHIQDNTREMVYVGGGAGMAPIRSHLSWLFESRKTDRRVSFWYGARSIQELFYEDYFRELEATNEKFEFYVAFSEAREELDPGEYFGFIHELLEERYLAGRTDAAEKEYYLCGPPAMVMAMRELLESYKVPSDQVQFNEF